MCVCEDECASHICDVAQFQRRRRCRVLLFLCVSGAAVVDALSLCIYRYSSCVIRECARGYAKMMGLDLGGEKER